MAGKDLELLDRFTKALKKSDEGAAAEVDANANVHLHVMPDRIIKEIRERIQEMESARFLAGNSMSHYFIEDPVRREDRKRELVRLIDRYEDMIFRILEASIGK